MTLYYFLTITASFSVIFFVIYYLVRLHAKEREFEAKTQKVDTEFHKIVNDAQAKERKILEDAASEADKIISGATYVSSDSKDVVYKALSEMIEDIKKESADTSNAFITNYRMTLKEITDESLKELRGISKNLDGDLQTQTMDFEKVTKGLEEDLENKLKTFNDTQVANLQKELDAYKTARMKEVEQLIPGIVQKASQEILNKSLSIDDHQKLIFEAFEKAKKQGLLDS